MKIYHEKNITNYEIASFKSFRIFEESIVPRLHFHAEVEIVYFHSGNGTWFIDSEIGEFKPGEVYIIGPNVPHTFQSELRADNAFSDAFCIQFLPEIASNYTELNDLKRWFSLTQRVLKFENIDSVLKNDFFLVTTLKGIESIMYLIKILAQLMQNQDFIFLKDKNYKPNVFSNNQTSRYDKCLAFIYDNYAQKITLDQIASYCSMTKQAFCRWFKQNFGQNFINYLNKIRINAVCQALLTTDRNIQTIATECGFESLSTMNRLFQTELGTSPSNYRKFK